MKWVTSVGVQRVGVLYKGVGKVLIDEVTFDWRLEVSESLDLVDIYRRGIPGGRKSMGKPSEDGALIPFKFQCCFNAISNAVEGLSTSQQLRACLRFGIRKLG